MARLTGKVAVVTGGAGGIGRAAARIFTAEGAQVLLVDLNEAALQEAVQGTGSDQASYVVADTTQPDPVQQYINTAVERYGGVDIVLTNAGVEGVVSPLQDYPIDEFDKVMVVNVRGVWLALKYAVPVMRTRGGGSIVITSSTAGIRGSNGMSAYKYEQTCCHWHDALGCFGMCSLWHSGQHREPGADRNAYDAVAGRNAHDHRGRRHDSRADQVEFCTPHPAPTLWRPGGGGPTDALSRQ